MDPLEFRRKNALMPGSITLTGETITEHYRQRARSASTRRPRPSATAGSTPEEKAREKRTGRKIGKGIAALHKAPAMPPFTATAVIVKMNSDGSVIVNLGLTEIGQGSTTAIAQIVAERLRFPIEQGQGQRSRRTPTAIPTTGRPSPRRG